MSYILEALKQSEHSRQQGKAAALNSLPPLLAPAIEPAHRAAPARLAILLGLSAAGLGLAWWQPWQGADAPPQTLQAARPLPPAPQAAPAATPEPSAEPARPVAQTLPTAEPSPVVAHGPLIRVDPPPASAAPPAPAPGPAQAGIQPAPAPEPMAPPPAAASLPEPPAGVLAFHELPGELRQSLPQLAVSGFSFAAEPELRMAVINERILRQGERVVPGVVVERIASDGVVLSYRGYRFRPH